MNDIGEIAKLTKRCLFADDTNVFIVSENPILLNQNAENTLLALSEWFAANKLSLNKDKSCYSICASPSKLISVPGYLNTIHLGEHTDELSKLLNKLANCYKINRYCIERDNKYNIYFAYTY